MTSDTNIYVTGNGTINVYSRGERVFLYPDANMIIQMLLLGFKVEEIPAVMHNRQTGVSMHSGLKPVIYMFRMVFSIIGVVFRVKVLKIDAGAGNEDVFLEEQK